MHVRELIACRLQTLARMLVGMVLVGSLASCGGSSSVSPEECQASAVALDYGDLPTLRGGGKFAERDLGSATSLGRPTLTGAPAGCNANATFSLEGTPLPPGLTLNPSTGGISGVPTTSGLYNTTVSITGPLFIDKRYAFLQWQVRDPAAFAWSGWDDGAAGGHAIPAAAVSLNVLGNRLALTFGGASGISTQQSGDGGVTWVRDTPAHTPAARENFAVADDGGTQIYIAGGRNGTRLLDEVWAFDGTDWRQVAAHGAFGPRENALLFVAGGHLFLSGGQSATLGLFDLWRSDDGGQTWTQVTWPGAQAIRNFSATCGAGLAGNVVIVGSTFNFGTGSHPDSSLWSSADGGMTWSERTPPSSSPFYSLNGGARQCVSSNGTLHVIGSGGWWNTVVDVVSTRDIDHWDFQPRSEAFMTDVPVPGAAMLDGQLHLAFGSMLYTSQR